MRRSTLLTIGVVVGAIIGLMLGISWEKPLPTAMQDQREQARLAEWRARVDSDLVASLESENELIEREIAFRRQSVPGMAENVARTWERYTGLREEIEQLQALVKWLSQRWPDFPPRLPDPQLRDALDDALQGRID